MTNGDILGQVKIIQGHLVDAVIHNTEVQDGNEDSNAAVIASLDAAAQEIATTKASLQSE